MLKYQKGFIFNGHTFVVNKEDVHNATDDMFVEATALLTEDCVKVVRCKECKHFDTADFDGDKLYGCTLESAMTDITPDSFCSYGERKEGAENG